MFNVANGIRHNRFLADLHRSHLFDWYMEIGCRSGRTFAPVRGKTIAVDPFFRVQEDVIGPKPALHVFQQTSDDFFASGFLKAMKIKLSFSFLDGLHLFEFLLRDLMNTESHSAPSGIIALHDCCPFSLEMTTRSLETTGPWTGDVWKLIPILQDYRPDLKLTMLDCKPTGIVLVSNLSPGNTVLKRKYDEIVARFEPLTLDSFGTDRFAASFAFTDARAYAAAGYPDLAAAALAQDSFALPQRTRT